jgi:leucyl/phenylalanyl-tRNA--protein transferase
MIPLLGPTDPFPPVARALDEPNGLLAAGGGLAVPRLVDAYSRGVFPWFSEGDPVLWWSPDPRMVLPTDGLHVSRSLARRLRKPDYAVTFDRAFADVLEACAAPRGVERGTWLVPSMIRAYTRLFRSGHAHSIEIWIEDELAGGVYGVALGRMFYGESMFSRRTDGSKIALACLCAQLRRWRFPIIDCQMRTSHLASLGAREMPRREFVALVDRLVREPGRTGPWTFDPDLARQLGTSANSRQPTTED